MLTSGTLPLPLARWFLFSSGSYSYPSGNCRDHMINAIYVEEERGRAPNLSVEQGRNLFRLDTGRDATFQSSLVP
jgi:hypothetical protein